MQRNSTRHRGRKSEFKGSVDRKRGRLATNELLSSSEDSDAFVSSVSSYFSCQKCFTDIEKNEPVITFCGHVFCWSCLYKHISLGTGRLRGDCPTCNLAVDLCPRTKTVCPIYYIRGPQAFPPTKDQHSSGSQMEIENRPIRSDISKSEKARKWVAGLIKVDPSQRPSDKRPNMLSSFPWSAINDSTSVRGTLEDCYHCLLRDWKSTIAELNNIIDDMQSCRKVLYLQLLKEHEQGFKSVSSSLSASLCSSSDYFRCNSCYGDASEREPLVTYCGHIFCKNCFCGTILESGLQECPVCRSAIDASSACPISGNGETCDNQNCETREKWQEAVLFLDPNALQLELNTLIGHLVNEIVVRTKSICNTILKVQHEMEDFHSGLLKELVGHYIWNSNLVTQVEDFMKENADQVSTITPNIKSCISVGRHSQVVQNKESFNTTVSYSSRSSFSCGSCQEATMHNLVVTYCTHLFCWNCLYLHIVTNGAFTEDGSLHGPCPICNANNIVTSPLNANLTVIPICKASNSVSQEYQKIEGEEDNIKRLPPLPVAKRISVVQLNRMKDITCKMICKMKILLGNWHLTMNNDEKNINFTYRLMKNERHRLLLGLLDGYRWAYKGCKEAGVERGVAGFEEAETRLNGLSEHWLDIVDVESSCMLKYEKEVLLR